PLRASVSHLAALEQPHVTSKQLRETFADFCLDGFCFGAADIRLLGWRCSRSRFNIWEMAQPCPKRGEKESNRADTGLHCGRSEDLFEDLYDVSWEERGRRRPGRDRAEYSPCEALQSTAKNGVRRVTLLEDFNRQKADAGIWETAFRNRSVEPGQLRSDTFKALS